MEGVMRECWQCKKKVSLKEMKYDSSGKDLICGSCLIKENRQGTTEIKEEKESTESTTTATTAATTATTDIVIDTDKKDANSSNTETKSDIVSYQCGSCKFGFAEKRNVEVTNCPYCGKENVRQAYRDSAQKLIEEAEREEFDD